MKINQVNQFVKAAGFCIMALFITNCTAHEKYLSTSEVQQYTAVYMQTFLHKESRKHPIDYRRPLQQIIFDGPSRTCIATYIDTYTGDTDYFIARWYKDADTLKMLPISQMIVSGTTVRLDSMLYEKLIEDNKNFYNDPNITPYYNSKTPFYLYLTDYVKFLIKGDELIPFWSRIGTFRVIEPEDVPLNSYKLVSGKTLWSQPILKRFIENSDFDR